MPIPVVCPKCSARLNAPDAAAGKKVKCPKCQGVIAVPEPLPAPAFEVVDDPEPPKKKPLPKVKADVVVDEDDERPRKKPVRAAQLDDDDEDDRPRKKRKKQAADNSAMIRNIVGLVVLIPLLGVAGYVFYDRYKDKKDEDKPSGDSASAKSGETGGPNKMLPLPGGGPVPAGAGPAGNPPVVPGGRKQPQPIGTPGQPSTLTAPSGFKVTFPGPYVADDPPPRIKDAVGLPIRLYVSADMTVRRQCFAASVELPAGATAAEKKQAYDKVVKTLVEEEGEKVEVLSRQTVTVGGRDWEEITARERGKSVGIARLLQTDSHIYLLLVADDAGTPPADFVKKFFDSFELTK